MACNYKGVYRQPQHECAFSAGVWIDVSFSVIYIRDTNKSGAMGNIKEIKFKEDTVHSIFHMLFCSGLYWGDHTWNNSGKTMLYRILELFQNPTTHNKIHIYSYKYWVCSDDHFFYGKMCYAFDELDRSGGFSMDKDIECCIDDSYGVRFLLQFSSYDFIKRFLSEVEN